MVEIHGTPQPPQDRKHQPFVHVFLHVVERHWKILVHVVVLLEWKQ
jgi:hypothetical protein